MNIIPSSHHGLRRVFGRHALCVLAASVLLAALPAVHAATYYIATNGNNNNDGLSTSSPWVTIAKANATLQAGDTVYIRAGTYSGASSLVKPANSGNTTAGPITYAAYSGETAILAGSTGTNFAIDLENCSYIVIDGLHVNGQQPWPNSTIKHWAQMRGSLSHHNTIKNCTIQYALGYSGIAVNNGSHHNQIIDNTIDHCGTYDNGAPSNSDVGDALQIYGNYNLIEGNILTHGGHNLLNLRGKYNIIRNNYFNNDWSSLVGAGKGNRCLEIAQTVSEFNVFEGNVVTGTGYSSDVVVPNAGMKAEGTNEIVRRNFIFNNHQNGLTTSVRSNVHYSRHSRIYHNVFYNLGGAAWEFRFFDGGVELNHQEFKNNIVYQCRQDPYSPQGNSDIFSDLTPSGSVILNNQVRYNAFYKATTGDGLVFIQGLPAGNSQTLTYMETNYPQYYADNLQQPPLFVVSNPDEPEDFKLQSNSLMIDAADFLTKTTSSGSGTTIPVADARYFHDGFGYAAADVIQVAGNSPVAIYSVDYVNHTITVMSSISWANGAGVSLPYNGSAPDIGAWEFDSGSAPAAPSSLTATAVSSSQIDVSWTDVTGETQYRVERKTGTGAFGALTTKAANSTSHSDTTVAASTSYTYQIRAENSNGNSNWTTSNSVTTPSGGGSGNLLVNPGFETTTGWTNYPTGSASQDGSSAHSGTYRLKIKSPDFPEVWQQVSVTPGAVYQASVWNLTWSSDGLSRGQMRLNWYQNGTPVGSPVTATSPNGATWTQIQSGGITAPTGATHLRITLKRSSTLAGNYYFDDAEITTASAPEINVTGSGLSISDGDTTPATADGTDFGSADISSGTVQKVFNIQNTGSSTLTLGTVTAGDDFTIVSQPGSSIAPAGNANFTVEFNPSATGLRTATISFSNNDADENPYNFSIQGTGTGVPEIGVTGNSVAIADGDTTPSTSDHTHFGGVSAASGSISRTFTVQNTGSAILTLGTVSISGTHASDYTVTTQPAANVAAAGSTTFIVSFDPAAAGVRTASLSFANNDANENPYNFSIQGNGLGNLLTNPGFETTTGWTNYPTGSASQDGSSAHSGTYRLKIKSPDFTEVWQQVGVTPGTVYQASAWNLTWSSDGLSRGQMRIDWYQNGTPIGLPVTVTSPNGATWTQVQSGNITAPTGATHLRITLKRSSTLAGNYFFDDAEISIAP